MTIPCREDMIHRSPGPGPQTDKNITEITAKLTNQLENADLQVYTPEIKDIEFFKNKLAKLISQVYLQVLGKAQTDVGALIADVLWTFLRLKREATASNVLLTGANVDSLYKFKRYILEPALDSGYIEMSVPDKPKSSKQTYRLTKDGEILFGY